jgi:hypothetical protein
MASDFSFTWRFKNDTNITHEWNDPGIIEIKRQNSDTKNHFTCEKG